MKLSIIPLSPISVKIDGSLPVFTFTPRQVVDETGVVHAETSLERDVSGCLSVFTRLVSGLAIANKALRPSDGNWRQRFYDDAPYNGESGDNLNQVVENLSKIQSHEDLP